MNKALRLASRSIAVFAVIAVLASCGSDESESAEWLFVQSAETATMSSSTLLEMPVDQTPFAFTDRPDRRHVYLPPEHFVDLWHSGIDNGFAVDPPNAVVTWFVGDSTGAENSVQEAEVVITSADYSKSRGVISYTVAVEDGEFPATEMREVSLFIDDASLASDSDNVIHCQPGNCPPMCSDPWISFNFDCIDPSQPAMDLPS